MDTNILEKYNIPVPRYTSYPPANFFHDGFTEKEYMNCIAASNTIGDNHLSFYFHIPYCRHLCHYCGCNSFPMAKPDVIQRYIEALFVEIEMVTKLLNSDRKITQIHYGGGSPTILQPSILKELNSKLLSKFQLIDQPEIAIECHPGYLTEKDWEALVDAGFKRFSIGIQDIREDVLRTVNRQPSLVPIEEIVNFLRSHRAKINMDFIYGLPLQTPETFASSIEFAAKVHPDRLVTFSYAHVPWVNKRQLILEKAGLPTSQEKSKMYDNARHIMEANGYAPIGLDHFVLRDDELYTALKDGKLHRNFQGYCTRRTTGQVYAFGVTGISQLHEAYAQNSKNIQTYMETIEAGHLAVAKGYALNEQQQIIREVIDTLMCNYRIDWVLIAKHTGKSVDEIKEAILYDENKLKNFAADKLISFDDDHLEMNADATPFVRNVAASFDRLLTDSSKAFSKPI